MYGIISHNVYHYKHAYDKTSGTDIMCNNTSLSYVDERQYVYFIIIREDLQGMTAPIFYPLIIIRLFKF